MQVVLWNPHVLCNINRNTILLVISRYFYHFTNFFPSACNNSITSNKHSWTEDPLWWTWKALLRDKTDPHVAQVKYRYIETWIDSLISASRFTRLANNRFPLAQFLTTFSVPLNSILHHDRKISFEPKLMFPNK